MKNPDIHVVVLCPGANATTGSVDGGGVHPREGSKFIVKHALEVTGHSPGFYNAEGEIPW